MVLLLIFFANFRAIYFPCFSKAARLRLAHTFLSSWKVTLASYARVLLLVHRIYHSASRSSMTTLLHVKHVIHRFLEL